MQPALADILRVIQAWLVHKLVTPSSRDAHKLKDQLFFMEASALQRQGMRRVSIWSLQFQIRIGMLLLAINIA